MASWNIRGLCKTSRQKELREFIKEEEISMCRVLETHIRKDKVESIASIVFGNWEWCANAMNCDRGCRILTGWDRDVINVMIITQSDQSMLYVCETVDGKRKFYCSIAYAETKGRERRRLWDELKVHKQFANGNAWVVMGDMNVILKAKECTVGSSMMTSDMLEFEDCVNHIEVKDMCSSGMQFTWTQKMLNPSSGILKKLDRVMVNGEFLDKFRDANAIFLPYLVSDHCPAVIRYY